MLIFTNGCFDILHVGHIQYLEQSKNLGDRLVVGLNSDASVRRLKGNDRPVNSQEDRKRMLEALRCVDEVVIFDEDTPYDLIVSLQPDIVTKGGDYRPEDVVGATLSRVVVLPYVEGKSTTRILNHENRRKGLGPRGDLG
jgi:D-beta-D-heptose 7-phosphate kinase / D-beta-D-heptose 1-phosphate adenosyltransferase